MRGTPLNAVDAGLLRVGHAGLIAVLVLLVELGADVSCFFVFPAVYVGPERSRGIIGYRLHFNLIILQMI